MKQFPIMVGQGTAGPCPSSIPWDAIAPYEGHALANHDQTLERLAQRGGLDPSEAYMVLTGRRWKGETFTKEYEIEACAFLDKLVRDRDAVRAERDALLLQVERLRKILLMVKEYRASADFDWTALDDEVRDALAGKLKCEDVHPEQGIYHPEGH